MDSQMPWSRLSSSNSQMYHQLPSQPSQTLDTSRRPTRKTTDSFEKACWDIKATEAFIRICVEELHAGNRPGSHFNKTGWENIVSKFQSATNRKYSRLQLKNRWDSLKKDWGVWITLLRGEIGIGWNHEKGTVDASPEWWERKTHMQPEAAKFRDRGPVLVHEQELLFSDVVATGQSAWTPSSGMLPRHLQDDPDDMVFGNASDNNLTDFEQTIGTDGIQHTNATNGQASRMNLRRNNNFPARICHKKKKKLSTTEKIVKCLERMVDTIEGESSSTRSQGGSENNYSIKKYLEILNGMTGVKEGDVLWMYATRLFLKPAVRELFLEINKDETRLKWLQDQMERDMQRKSFSMTSATFVPRGVSHHTDNASSG